MLSYLNSAMTSDNRSVFNHFFTPLNVEQINRKSESIKSENAISNIKAIYECLIFELLLTFCIWECGRFIILPLSLN